MSPKPPPVLTTSMEHWCRWGGSNVPSVIGVGVLTDFTGIFPAVLVFSLLLAVLCLFSIASIRRAL
jgi:hypothetical protein